MNKNGQVLEEAPAAGKQKKATVERWFDDEDGFVLDMDCFVKTLAGIKAKGVRPDLLGSIVAHYASKWLPELSSSDGSSASATASWMKKRFVVETLAGVLPAEREAVPCGFVLRLFRTASMVGADAGVRAELERRAASQLDEASLGDLMIPSFSHTCETLLDVGLVLRLVRRFVAAAGDGGAAKVAKVVDSYLAEAAVDSCLAVAEFVALAEAVPSHARALDDGLYRAIDTYLKAHPGLAKQERKRLCQLIDGRKLSREAAVHAAHNDRLPVRAALQIILFSNTDSDWSGSFDSELRRLRDDLLRLQTQFDALRAHMDTLSAALDHHHKYKTKKRVVKQQKPSSFGFLRWKRFGFVPGSFMSTTSTKMDEDVTHCAFDRQTPLDVNIKTSLVRGSRRRRSIS